MGDSGELYRAVDSLPEEIRDMRMKLRCLGDENHKLEAGMRLKAMNEWGGGHSQSSDQHCVCVWGGGMDASY